VPWTALVLGGEASPAELNLAPRHRASAAAAVVGAGALVARRPLLALGAAGGLLALNWRFYALVARRRGPLAGALALPLHALHHLSSVAAVPAGVASHLLGLRAGAPPASPGRTRPRSARTPRAGEPTAPVRPA
jgi:hypothetical protein